MLQIKPCKECGAMYGGGKKLIIDEYALLSAIKARIIEWDYTAQSGVELIEFIRDIISEMPSIDAEPVRHGRWVINANGDGYHCSNCGHYVDSPIGEMIDPRDYEGYLDKYCGGCGAEMIDERGDSDATECDYALWILEEGDYNIYEGVTPDKYVCSKCGCIEYRKSRFCPNCGRTMKEDNSDATD